ncbi:unnamed protein product [Discosporangium mesarthrocarpum]
MVDGGKSGDVLMVGEEPCPSIPNIRYFLESIRAFSIRNLTGARSRVQARDNQSREGGGSESPKNLTPRLGALPSLRCRFLLGTPGSQGDGKSFLLCSTDVCPSTANPTWAVSETAWLKVPVELDLEKATELTLLVVSVDVNGTGMDEGLHNIASAPTGEPARGREDEGVGVLGGKGKADKALSSTSSLPPLKIAGESLLCSFEVDVRQLVALQSGTRLSHLSALPPDCLFMDMGDHGLFTPAWVRDSLLATGITMVQPLQPANAKSVNTKSLPRGLTRVDSSISVSSEQLEEEDLQELLQKVVSLEATAAECRKELGAEITLAGPQQRQDLEAVRRDSVIARLRQELAEQQELLEGEQACLEGEKLGLEAEAAQVNMLLSEIKATEGMVAQEEINLGEETQETLKSQVLLEARRARLTAELKVIYPIKYQGHLGEYTIRGLELPGDLYTVDDERVSSALGYCTHLVSMLSKYLQVPLRYQLIYNASRSAVRDNIIGAGVAYPLFRRGVEKERFDRGVHLLGKDVEQLLGARGVPAKRGGGQLLRNLERLMAAESV